MTGMLAAQAQSWLDYDQALSGQSWLRTSNAAALTTYQPTDSTQRLLADASIGLTTEHGHLSPLGLSPHSWAAMADVRSIYRVNPRVVLRGGMCYRNNWGSHVGGSVWIAPEQMPFDITETADTTSGDISLESYGLQGEVGVVLGHGLSMGARFGYNAASYAKKKDPRHTNQLMQLQACAGAIWQVDGITLGANYLLGRSTEALNFSTYGRTDRVYHYLIDYGAWFGRNETTDGKGYVGRDYEKPLLDMRHGIALQAGYSSGPWSAVVEWQWAHRHGHYGIESPSMLDFNRHHGDEWHLQSWWQHAHPETIHRISTLWSHEDVKDYERNYRITSDAGITQVVYYDDREMSHRQVDRVTIAYDGQWAIRRHLAAWHAHVSIDYRLQTITASLFPYYRWQQTHYTDITLHGQRNWLTACDHTWSLGIGVGYGTGGGTPYHDGMYDLSSEDNASPASYRSQLMRQYEWFTASRLHSSVSLRWSMPLADQRLRPYVDLCYAYAHAINVHWMDDPHRHTATLILGCMF